MNVVALHGFLQSPHLFGPPWLGGDGALSSSATLSPLRVFAPSLPGHGPEGTRGATTDFVSEVARWAPPYDGACVLVGYSMGARLALALSREVRRPRALLLLGGHPGFAASAAGDARRADRRRKDETRADVLDREGLDAFVRAWEREPVFATQAHLASDLVERQRAWRTSHQAAAVAWSLRTFGLGAMPGYGHAPADVPTLVLIGERDAALQEAWAHGALQGYRVEMIAGAGHSLLLEARDETLARVRSFLIAFPTEPFLTEPHPRGPHEHALDPTLSRL